MSRWIIVSNRVIVCIAISIPRLRSLGGGWYNGIWLNETSEFGVVAPGAVVQQLNVTVISLTGESVVGVQIANRETRLAKALYSDSPTVTPFASVVRDELPRWSPSRKERVVLFRTARYMRLARLLKC